MREGRRSDNSILFALYLNIAALAAALFAYKPFLEENDDAFIAMIAEGAYGTREPHLIYTNIILGYVYKGLYTLCPYVRWHGVLQYLFLFIALTALTYLVVRLNGSRILAVLLTLAVSYEAYVSVQYSKTAALVCGIAYLCLLYTFQSKQSERPERETTLLFVIAYVLLIYGMLLRDSSFLLATLMLLPAGVYGFISLLGSGDQRSNSKIRKFIVLFAAAGCLFLISSYINKTVYDRDPEWKQFLEYNDTRTRLLDYRYDLMDYNKYGSRLEEMGISENDALLYLTWQFGDDKVFGEKEMQQVLNGMPGRGISVDLMKKLIQHIYEDVLVFDPLVLGTIILIIYAFSVLRLRRDRGRITVLLLQLIVFAGILVYYEYSGRWSHRIVYAAMQLIAVSTVYLLSCGRMNEAEAKDGSGRVETMAVVLVAIACVTVLVGNRLEYNAYKRNAPDYRAFLEEKCSGDTLCIADTFTFQKAYKYDVFKPYAEGSLRSFAAVGSWYVNSPVTKKITGRFGYDNPFAALAYGGGDVILVDNMYADEKLEYLREHYTERGFVELSSDHGLTQYGLK